MLPNFPENKRARLYTFTSSAVRPAALRSLLAEKGVWLVRFACVESCTEAAIPVYEKAGMLTKTSLPVLPNVHENERLRFAASCGSPVREAVQAKEAD